MGAKVNFCSAKQFPINIFNSLLHEKLNWNDFYSKLITQPMILKPNYLHRANYWNYYKYF